MDRVLSRPYHSEDFGACLSIFDSNVPRFFSPKERVEFVKFLEDIEPAKNLYMVLTLKGSIVASGGLSIEAEPGTASLSWGMVDQAWHRQGLGSRLTDERLKLARSSAVVATVVLATSQHTRSFYERYGFRVVKITPDGFAAGLDRYDMAMRLA